jgi:predicted DsbA family dithiol-disulfide isomerase
VSETLSNIARSNDRVAPNASLHVEVIADFVCPFCFLGKRRLDEALKAVKGPSDVHWYPYQLNPEIPADGQPLDDFLTRRFSSPANVEPVLKHLTEEGKAAGIDFRFDKIRRVPNTLAVHQLMELAETREVDQSSLADDLLKAFFEEGRNIGDRGELIDVAATHGISAGDANKAIDSDEISGLAGVPGYLLNRRLLVVGAQNTDAIVSAFDRAMFGEGADSVGSPALH